MQSKYSFTLNENLFLKDPLESSVGRDIIAAGAPLFLEIGLEGFTLKKLAQKAGTTEATLYKYFKNKQRLLQYYFQLYWTWLEQQIKVFTATEKEPSKKLLQAVRIVCDIPEVAADPGVVSKHDLRKLVIAEGSKAYLHVQVDNDNEKKLFAPYKSLANYLGAIVKQCKPDYPYPVALATTLLEMAHSMQYYMEHLPSLTDFSETQNRPQLSSFLESLIHSSILNSDKL